MARTPTERISGNKELPEKRRRKKQPKTSPNHERAIGWFARQTDPFQSPDLLLARLKLETSESKFLEWKQTPPIGPNVSLRTKYRVVKAIISFANTEGGFVVFGISSKGLWLGFAATELQQSDAAALAELINGCVSPEIWGLNYAELKHDGRLYPVLHVPPSPQMPHVTTKDIQEKLPDGQHVFHLNKHAVYCRYTAKSDLATAAQFARIIASRTDFLKAEMLRRVKEVEIPSFQTPSKSRPSSPTLLRISQVSKDPLLPAVRITRNPAEATGLVVQEELSDALFEEINNVLDANKLLAQGRSEFVFSQEIYHRVYAERHHVQDSSAVLTLLARAGALKFYAPACHWLLRLSPKEVADLMVEVLQEKKSNNNRLVCRLAVLMGTKVTSWLKGWLDQRWSRHAQPAQHYFTFKEMLKKVGKMDPRLVALQMREGSEVDSPTGGAPVSCAELLESRQVSAALLSKACMAVFNGDKSHRGACRFFDVMTYGPEFAKIEDAVYSLLEQRTN